MSAPTTQAGTVPEDIQATPDLPSILAAKIMQLDWARGSTADEQADRYGQIQELILVEINMAGFSALAKTAALQAELGRVIADRCMFAEWFNKANAERLAAEQQLSELRAEMETVREAISRIITTKRMFSSFNCQTNGHFLTNNGETEFMTVKESRRLVDGIWMELNGVLATMPAARSASRDGVR
ncbi:hypothetical protein [Aureimonas sp. N4]|uniref:hypothetical protein n=1 Tax=Aureimonas sp. N4 TaxID=1638165 RepID=UPI0007864DD7|nr:hypothetical protein [Aureimonas sp. N4]